MSDCETENFVSGDRRNVGLVVVCALFSHLCAVWTYLWIACAFGMSLGSADEWLQPFFQYGVLGPLIGIVLLKPCFFRPTTRLCQALCFPVLLFHIYWGLLIVYMILGRLPDVIGGLWIKWIVPLLI